MCRIGEVGSARSELGTQAPPTACQLVVMATADWSAWRDFSLFSGGRLKARSLFRVQLIKPLGRKRFCTRVVANRRALAAGDEHTLVTLCGCRQVIDGNTPNQNKGQASLVFSPLQIPQQVLRSSRQRSKLSRARGACALYIGISWQRPGARAASDGDVLRSTPRRPSPEPHMRFRRMQRGLYKQ